MEHPSIQPGHQAVISCPPCTPCNPVPTHLRAAALLLVQRSQAALLARQLALQLLLRRGGRRCLLADAGQLLFLLGNHLVELCQLLLALGLGACTCRRRSVGQVAGCGKGGGARGHAAGQQLGSKRIAAQHRQHRGSYQHQLPPRPARATHWHCLPACPPGQQRPAQRWPSCAARPHAPRPAPAAGRWKDRQAGRQAGRQVDGR